MKNCIYGQLLTGSVLFGLTLGIIAPSQAEEVPNPSPTVSETSLPLDKVQPQETDVKISSPENLESANPLEQITSVSELKDVQPTEWAYEALKSLVERYGCIVGYPNQTFRGVAEGTLRDRALTRWEFAAGLNACVNTLERLLQENVAVLREDIDKLTRLTQEFEAELAALGARIDNLESRTAYLEDHQFSTTVKLTGDVIFALTDAFQGTTEGSRPVLQDRLRLVLESSFTGKDLLTVRLAAGDAKRFQFPGYPFNAEGNQTFNLPPGNNSINLDWLAYEFPINDSLYAYIPAYSGR